MISVAQRARMTKNDNKLLQKRAIMPQREHFLQERNKIYLEFK